MRHLIVALIIAVFSCSPPAFAVETLDTLIAPQMETPTGIDTVSVHSSALTASQEGADINNKVSADSGAHVIVDDNPGAVFRFAVVGEFPSPEPGVPILKTVYLLHDTDRLLRPPASFRI